MILYLSIQVISNVIDERIWF